MKKLLIALSLVIITSPAISADFNVGVDGIIKQLASTAASVCKLQDNDNELMSKKDEGSVAERLLCWLAGQGWTNCIK